MKHKCNQDFILDGKIYKSIKGVVDLPQIVDSLELLEEIKESKSEKDELLELALNDEKITSENSATKIKRMSVETLKSELGL